MSVVIWWTRRDLRLQDNEALQAALETGGFLIPLFILDPYLLRGEALARQAFLFGGLRELDAELRKRGSQLIIRSGPPEMVLNRLVEETGAELIFAAHDTGPYANRRDERVARILPLKLVGGITVHPPQAIRQPDGKPYTVFTPFSKAWKALPISPPRVDLPERFPPLPALTTESLPEVNDTNGLFIPGELSARQRLEDFLGNDVWMYHEVRDRLDLEGTSKLSPYLRFGMLSPRLAATRVLELSRQVTNPVGQRGCETWLNELIWRDFYHSVLFHFPFVVDTAFQPMMRAMPWRHSEAELAAWQFGQTGYPVVDACMRQLIATGWMHNRGRMIVASFLSKDLLIHWREGERWFMRHLIDGDLASNLGGWQWTAGVGTDAAPFFRIFNPVLQGKKFDPEGVFIRRWLPELETVPSDYIHSPWLMPQDIQRKCGVRIGVDYPMPMVDHALARERALRWFRSRAEK